MIGNLHYWRSTFIDTFAKELTTWRTAVVDRLLPTFENISEEADDLSEAEFVRRGRLPGTEDSFMDMSDAADLAFEDGLAHWERMEGARQGLLNLATVGLHHLFEQQAALFVRRELITPAEERDPKFMLKLYKGANMMKAFDKRLRVAGIDPTVLPSFQTLEELRLVANVVKHGGGSAGEELRKRNPRLFVAPILRNELWTLKHIARDKNDDAPRVPRVVDRPLTGNDLYVTSAEFSDYADSAIHFWSELAGVLHE